MLGHIEMQLLKADSGVVSIDRIKGLLPIVLIAVLFTLYLLAIILAA
jgi:hypothetical protein